MGPPRDCLATLLPSVEPGWQPLSTQQLPKHTHKNTNAQGTFQNHFRTIFALNQNPVATAGFTSCHHACVGGGTFLENYLPALYSWFYFRLTGMDTTVDWTLHSKPLYVRQDMALQGLSGTPETWDHLLLTEMQTPFWMALALFQSFCPREVPHERRLL